MFKVLDEVCKPRRGTRYSAYVDLYARENMLIRAGETKIVPLGVKLDLGGLKKSWLFYAKQNWMNIEPWEQFLKSHYLEIAIRSSLAVKGLIIANGTGKVDLDYPKEIGIILHNPLSAAKKTFFQKVNYALLNDISFEIKRGEKIAQCTIVPHKGYLLGCESDEERTGGFGSTGR